MIIKKSFTLAELIVVIVIITLFFSLIFDDIPSRHGDRRDDMVCKTNLKQLGTTMINYSLDNYYFPCGVIKGDSMSQISAKKDSNNRSTLETFRTFKAYDNTEIEHSRFFCPLSGSNVPRRTTDSLESSNVGYHYVNGNVSTRHLKADMALIRDLNEGHYDGKSGNVLMASGAVLVMRKFGKKISNGNYKTNWYQNKSVFKNYRSFDHYNKPIVDDVYDFCD